MRIRTGPQQEILIDDDVQLFESDTFAITAKGYQALQKLLQEQE